MSMMLPKDCKTQDKTKDELDAIYGILPPDDNSSSSRGIASQIVSLIEQRGELFHDKDDKTYVEIELKDTRQTFLLGSKQFKQLAGQMLYEARRKTASRTALDDAINTLSGKALYDGGCRDVSLRVAKHGGDYYIDLCDDAWRAVRVNENGWKVMERPEPTFRRTPHMRPLPKPVKGGDIGELVKVVNIEREELPLLVAWIFECFRPDTPFPVLELCGEQGSGKSTTQKCIRDLIDPNAANLRAEPRSIKDLLVGATQNWVCSYNNLSHLSAGVQDALCNLSTGGGYAARVLFTDQDEIVTDITRPVVINGISALATRQDLVDRTIRLMLPQISPDMRQRESMLDQDFAQTKARLFGTLLTIFVAALRELPSVKLDALPRMADFAMLGEAVCRAMGWPVSFNQLFYANRFEALEISLASSPVIGALRRFMGGRTSYDAPAGHLLSALNDYKEGTDAWPSSPKGFADLLRRHAPALREIGIELQFLGHRRDGNHILVRNIVQQGSQHSQSSPEQMVDLPTDDPTSMIEVAV